MGMREDCAEVSDSAAFSRPACRRLHRIIRHLCIDNTFVRATPHSLRPIVLAGAFLAGCAPPQPPGSRASDLPGRSSASLSTAGPDAAHAWAVDGACTYSAWSPPLPLGGVPAGAVIRSPSLAVGNESAYVVGNNIALFDTAPSPPRPLIAITDRGEDVGRPAGDFLFASPRGVLDGDGILHIVWAEPRDWRPVRRQDWFSLPSRYALLWHATYTPGRGWSRPERVHASSRVSWQHGRADLMADRAGLHAVTADDSAQTVIHLSFRGRAWQTARIPSIDRAPAYASIAGGRDGRLYVAYVGADRSQRADANSVFLVRSLDGGHTWLPPQRISRSGANQATEIEALAAPDGTVHLLWAQNRSGGLLPEVVRHVSSRDGGETWSTPDDVDVPDGFGTMHAVVDGCGGVHLVYEVVAAPGAEDEPEQGQLWYARWAGGWTVLEQPFAGLNATEAALATASNGSPRLVWSVVHAAKDAYETTFSSVVSRLDVHR